MDWVSGPVDPAAAERDFLEQRFAAHVRRFGGYGFLEVNMRSKKMRHVQHDDDDEVADGETVRVPLLLRDQRQLAFDARDHMPGFRHLSDDAVRDAQKAARASRDQYVRALCDAWKLPARDAGAEPDDDPDDNGSEPDNSSPAEVMRRHLYGGESIASLEKDVAVRRRCSDLESAWRNPSGRVDPGTALAIEHRRRAYTYETGR